MPVSADVLVDRQWPCLLMSTIGHWNFQGKSFQQPRICIGEKSGAIVVYLEDWKRHVFFVHYYAPRGTEPHVRLHGVLHLEVPPGNGISMG